MNNGEVRCRKAAIKDLLSAFLLPAAVFLLLLWKNRILPFGETTLLFSDLDSQYIEFMAEYRRILTGGGSLFYAWNAGLGMNFLALTAYYLASPFNFLLVLFPESGLPLAVSLITVLKLSFAGAAFARFLQVRFRGAGLWITLFSACYALNAWAVGYAFNIMWLDALILLPLLCAGIERLLRRERYAMAVLIPLFALSFISQFYMAYMTGVFSALYFLTLLITRKTAAREWLLHVLRFGICVVIAAGLSAILLVPTFFVLKNNMGLMGQSFPGLSVSFPLPEILRKLFIGSFDGVKNCLPHIYCGLPALIGLVLYFSGNSITRREKIISAMIGIFLLGSFWFPPLDFLWHAMDHPSWFPYRYAFLFCFWTLSCAFQGFAGTKWDRSFLWKCAILLIPPAVVFLSGKNIDSRFLWINLLFVTAYALSGCFAQEKIRPALLLLICAAELTVNGAITVEYFTDSYTKLADYQSFQEHYRELTSAVLPTDTEFYRMEKTEIRNYNDPLGIGYPGVSHFSSTASTRQAEFLKRLGFNCYATWCTYQGSTAATDALLQIRYEFGKSGKTDSLPVRDEIREHPAQFPLFFFAGEDFARYNFMDNEKKGIQRQNDLLKLLEGTDAEDFFEEIPVRILRAENLEKKDGTAYRRQDPGSPAFLEAEVTPVSGRSCYLFVSGASLSYNVYVNDSLMINANSDYSPFPVCLDGFASDGETVRIRVETTKETLGGTITAWALDVDRLLALSSRYRDAAPVIQRTGTTDFFLKTDPAAEERLVVSSIPFDAGWQVKADEKPLPLKMIHESVLGFVLPADCTEISVSFRPYGWEIGLSLSGIALMLWAALFIYEKSGKINQSPKCKTPAGNEK